MAKYPQLAFLYVSAMSLCLSMQPGNKAFAENVSFRSESIVRILERDTATETDALIVPAYEYIQLDLGEPGESNLTFHAHGWGRADLTDSDYFSDQTTGELLYGYLEYRLPEYSMLTRLGRQTIFAGVANDSIDGLYLDFPLATALRFSAYAGQPVSLSGTNGRAGDAIYGGRISLDMTRTNLGLSYKLVENDSIDAEEMAGFDYGLLVGDLLISGLSSFNLVTEDFAEHSFDAVMTAADNRFRLFYQFFTFADYFGTGANNANPFRVMALTSEELSSYGIEISRRSSATFEIGIRLTRNDYDLEEASHYVALLADWNSGSTSYGGEFGISEGENGRNDMIIARGFITTQLGQSGLLDQMSLDLLYATYDQPIFGEDTSLFASVAGKKNLSDTLLLKLSADYESNPYYNSDIRGLVSLIYSYSAN